MAEQALDKRLVIAELTRSTHGALVEFVPVASKAANLDPEFFGHLIAWNHVKGEVRDSKIALPAVALVVPGKLRFETKPGVSGPVASEDDDAEPQKAVIIDTWLNNGMNAALVENALAHLCDQSPKEFVKALDFVRSLGGPYQTIKRMVHRYLRNLEQDWRTWERVAIQHRAMLRKLYSVYHVSPFGSKDSKGDVALMKGAAVTGKFAAVRNLSSLSPVEIGGMITRYRIPFLIARGALGAKAKEPDVVLALIKAMTSTELVTNAAALRRLGVGTNGMLKAAFDASLEKAGSPKRAKRSSLKATRAADVAEAAGDVQLATKLRTLQEKQFDSMAGVDGNWLVLADCSSSMSHAMDLARQLSAVLAKSVKGKVHLVFFNTSPRYFEATGRTYEDLSKLTKGVTANGGTVIGVGLQYIVERGIEVDGIALVSDGGQNAGHPPTFSTAYAEYEKRFSTRPTVYHYLVPGDPNVFESETRNAGIQVEQFDLRTGGRHGQVDYHSLPNLVQTMRVSRYSLVDEIYAAPLRTVDDVLDKTVGMRLVPSRNLVTA